MLGVLLLVLSLPSPAQACSACSCGDPTLTVMGSEQPFAGRLRLSTELRYRTDQVGEPGVDALALQELRLDLGASYAPRDWWVLSATAPVVFRDLTFANLSNERAAGLGDVELRGKAIVFQRESFRTRHLFGVMVGAKLPTAPLLRDSKGRTLSADAQAGTGSLDAQLGLSYAYFARPWSLYASVTGLAPVLARKELVTGPSLRTTVAVQRHLDDAFAVQLGVDTRHDRPTLIDGTPDADSGGSIAFLSPELLFSPRTDLLLIATVRIPVLNRLQGFHREGYFFSVGAIFDL